MAAAPDDRVSLPDDDFRKEREYLAPHVFAIGGDDRAPDDLIDESVWRDLAELTTDVLIRTTSYAGSVVNYLHALLHAWHEDAFATRDNIEDMPISFLRAQEELEAAVFNAIHGYYRPGISCLRTAIENVASGAVARIQSGQDEGRDENWSTALSIVRGANRFSEFSRRERNAVLGGNQGSWAANLNRQLSRHTHGVAGATNDDLWQSNGPVFAPDALELFVSLFEETIIMLYILRSVFAPDGSISDVAAELVRNIEDDGDGTVARTIRKILHIPE